jgi:cold shock CspA family protein
MLIGTGNGWLEMVDGHVKWFNAEKGYGFVTRDDDGTDVFVHYSMIEMRGYRVLEEGQRVRFEVKEARNGPQADRVQLATEESSQESEPSTQPDDLVGLALIDGRLKPILIDPAGHVSFLEGLSGEHQLLFLSALPDTGAQDEIDAFEDLVNTRGVSENALQTFLASHPHFLTGDDYASASSHIVLEREHDGPLIPDFVLKPHDPEGLADLVELKLPSAKLLIEKQNRVRLSAAVFEACAQLRAYSDYFESEDRRLAVADRFGIKVFRPRLYIVIGRRGKYDPAQFRAAERDLQSFTVRTYDDLIERARARLGRPTS